MRKCKTTLANGNRCIEPILWRRVGYGTGADSPYCQEHTIAAMRLAEEERDAALAACAELKKTLGDHVGPNLHHGKSCICAECRAFRLAKSTSAGTGWVSPEKFSDVIEALEHVLIKAKRSANKILPSA